jgi:hypothetical protein
MLRTLDWINDVCESKLRTNDRPRDGRITYAALMSPVKVHIWQRRAGRYREFAWPISLLITDDLVLIGTKRGKGRRARVYRAERTRITSAPRRAPVRFTFASNDEVAFLTELIPGISAERAVLERRER